MLSAPSRATEQFPNGPTDAELVSRAEAGDEVAFELILRRYNQLLFRTARSIVRNDADAEDVVQEACMRAWRGLGSFRSDSRLATWLVRITVNEALGRMRRKHHDVIPLERVLISHDAATRAALVDHQIPGAEDALMQAEIRSLVEAHIDRLPESFRTVFVLRAVEDLSVEEVAAALDIPAATVRTRLFRAKAMLRKSLERDADESLRTAFSFAGARCDRIVAAVLVRGRAEGLSAQR